MMASMVTLRPNMELWRTHRQELTDPWVGPGAGRNEEMIRRHVHELIDSWIDDGEVKVVANDQLKGKGSLETEGIIKNQTAAENDTILYLEH